MITWDILSISLTDSGLVTEASWSCTASNGTLSGLFNGSTFFEEALVVVSGPGSKQQVIDRIKQVLGEAEVSAIENNLISGLTRLSETNAPEITLE